MGQIDGADPANPAPSSASLGSRSVRASKDGTTTNGTGNGVLGQKRKPEGSLSENPNKIIRKESTSVAGKPASASLSPAAATSASNTQPYRGTARLEPSKLPPRPIHKPATTTKPNAPFVAATAAAPAPATTTPTAIAPKKGSYAEILARGKQIKNANIGKIQNKPTESIKVKDNRKAGRITRGRSESREPRETQSAGEGGDDAKGKRKPLDLGYKGTARSSSAAPAPKPVYKGTMGLKRPGDVLKEPLRRLPGGRTEKVRYAGYATWSDEEGKDDGEGEYNSDASSDMEADRFDVDQEEELSLKHAKKEDAEEQAKLEQHDREKRERKYMLAKMAAAKRNKKRIL